jgi:hypothetical protein
MKYNPKSLEFKKKRYLNYYVEINLGGKFKIMLL